MSSTKKLHDDDFPLKTDKTKITTSDGETVADGKTEQVAEDIADRLNEDAWRRQEDNWSA